jgi:hypothetical protein
VSEIDSAARERPDDEFLSTHPLLLPATTKKSAARVIALTAIGVGFNRILLSAYKL